MTTAAYMGFCASGADGKNISICAAIISGSGRPITISKPTNNQLFILHSADGSGRRNVEFPICAKPWTLAVMQKRPILTV